MGDPLPTIHLRLTGRVQGVGFRYFAQRRAQELGLRGWVRNAPDGSVEVLAGGAAASLESFKAVLRRGPAGAQVAGMEEEILTEEPAGAGFEITYGR